MQKTQKKLKTILIVLVVIIIPAVFRIWDTDALSSIRNVDIALIFGLGFALGAFFVNLKQ